MRHKELGGTVLFPVAATSLGVLPVFLVGGLASSLRPEFAIGPSQLGLTVSLGFATAALASVPIGRVVERLGPGTSMRAGLAISATCLVAAGFAESWTLFAIPIALSGLANVFTQLGGNLALAQQIPSNWHGRAFGIKQAAIPLAMLLAGLAVPAIGSTVGWRWAYYAAAAICVLVLLGFRNRSGGECRVRPVSLPRAWPTQPPY